MNKRAINTKNNIKQALFELLSRNELEDISIVLICNHAKVGRRTFYDHFDDKFEVMALLVDEYIEKFETIILSMNTQTNFKESLMLGFKYLYDNSNFFKVLYHSSLSKLFLKRVEKLIKNLIKERINRAYLQQQKISEDTVLTFLTHAVMGIMIDIGVNKDKKYLEKADEVMRIILPYFKRQHKR